MTDQDVLDLAFNLDSLVDYLGEADAYLEELAYDLIAFALAWDELDDDLLEEMLYAINRSADKLAMRIGWLIESGETIQQHLVK